MRRPRITVVILLFIAIAVTFWVNIPGLVGLLISTSLKDIGATQVRIKVSRIGWQQGHIHRLDFHKQLAQRDLKVETRHLSIQYTWAGLLNGRLENIILPDTTITISPADASIDTTRKIDLAAFRLPDAGQIPVNKLLIEKLNIIHQHENKQQDRVLMTGWLERQQQAVAAALVFKQQDHQDLKVELNMQQQLVKLNVGNDGSATSWMSLSVQEVIADDLPKHLKLKSRVDLARLAKLINAWGYAKELTGVAGDVQLQMQLPANTSDTPDQGVERETIPTSLYASLQLSIDQWQGYASEIVANLDWQATMNKELIEWRLSKNSFLRSQPDIKSLSNTQTVWQDIIASQQKSRLHIDFPNGLSGTLPINQTSNISINESIHLQYQYHTSKPLLTLTLNALSIKLHPDWNIKTRFVSQLNLTSTGIADIKSMYAALAGDVDISPQIFAISIDKQTTATIVPARQPSYDITPVLMKLTKRAECQFISHSKSTKCKQLAVALGALNYSQGEERLSADRAYMTLKNVSLDDGQLRFTGDTLVKNIVASNQAYAVNLGQLNASIEKTASKLRIKSELLTLKGDIKTRFAIDHYSATGKGLLEFELLPVDFAKIRKIPARLLSRGQLPIKLLSGKLASHGRFKWEPGKDNSKTRSDDWRVYKQLEISIDNLAGSYKQTGFIDLGIHMSLAGVDTLATTEPMRLQLHKLDAGLILSDIQMDSELHFKTMGMPEVVIQSLNGKVLGGEIKGKNINIDLQRSHNPFVISINSLDLTKLLEWQQVKGISGTGLLDVHLPFDLTDKGLTMREGMIQARKPGGRLRYIADERVRNMAQSNSNIKMLLEALNNFIYSELSAKSNYSTDGALELEVALKGKNPDFHQGKAINLNINIEENLLKLLKSLQLGEEISKKISDQLQQQK